MRVFFGSHIWSWVSSGLDTRKFETSHVGGATGRTPPIPRSALEKDPRPGPLFEGNPVAIVFTGWREYVAYRVCLYLRENFPLLRLELILDGNSSQIKVEINEVETENISQCLEKLITDWKVL